MNRYQSLILATVAISAVAFGQNPGPVGPALANPGFAFDAYQVNYAANLNVGDSQINFTNTGFFGGFIGAGTSGNICVNTYVFDPQEEEIGCCACLVTPNGLMSLSAQADLISNNLTPAVPTSIVVKLLSSQPSASAGNLTVCNPATVTAIAAPGNAVVATELAPGMRAWMNTLEPAATPGTYEKVHSSFLPATLSGSELNALTTTCNFIQSNGTGYGICKSCRLGALGGSKQ